MRSATAFKGNLGPKPRSSPVPGFLASILGPEEVQVEVFGDGSQDGKERSRRDGLVVESSSIRS